MFDIINICLNSITILYSNLYNNIKDILFIDFQNTLTDIKIEYIKEIGNTLINLHNIGIIHSNLNINNIYLSNNNEIQLIDYCFPPFYKSNYSILYFQSPEIILCKEYNEKTDSWSFGCVFYYFLTLNYLFYNKKIKNLIISMLHPNFSNVDEIYKEILSKLISTDQLKRITIEECLEMINEIEKEKYEEIPHECPLSYTTIQTLFYMNNPNIYKIILNYYGKSNAGDLSEFSYDKCYKKPTLFFLILQSFSLFLNILKDCKNKKDEYTNKFYSDITSIYFPNKRLFPLMKQLITIFEEYDINRIIIII